MTSPVGAHLGGGRGPAPVPDRRMTMSIGEVLAALRPDYPDVTISKIRFLETEGLVEPQRTPSGYRKFTHDDVARLRYVLAAQRDHYLPLRVIKDHLAAIDRGLEPPTGAAGPRVPRAVAERTPYPGPDSFSSDNPGLRLSRAELLAAADVEDEQLAALESFGLVRPLSTSAAAAAAAGSTASSLYDEDALVVARCAGRMARFGLEPRHLRGYRTAAEREVGLVEQVIAPMQRKPGADSRARADEAVKELASLSVQLHAALVRAALRPGRGV